MRRESHEQNRRSWNLVIPAHDSHKHDQAGFLRAGGSTLFPDELGLLGVTGVGGPGARVLADMSPETGPLAGLDLVHLQCNVGQDSLSLARLGARVTGVDISDEAIARATQLAADAGIAASFVRADVYDWLATTAAGRAYLAATPTKEREHLMAALAEKIGADWPAMRESLEASFEEFDRTGFCMSLGDWDRNVNAAGVALHLQDGSIMVLTCGAPSFQLSEEKLKGSLAHELEMLARDIESLGV